MALLRNIQQRVQLWILQAQERPVRFLLKHMDEMSRADLEDKMKAHLRNKTLVRQVKDKVKELAKTDEKINGACFDLQQVLTTPKSMSSQLYYRRKLSTFNLTVFNLARKHGSCYMWHEGVGKRGANNIASCVWQYIHTASSHGAKEFHFFSDNCGGKTKILRYLQCIIMLYRLLALTEFAIITSKGGTQKMKVIACTQRLNRLQSM